MKRTRTRASALALAFAFAFALSGVTSGAARASAGPLPDFGRNVTVGSLPAGGLVIVRPTSGAPVAAVELWYRAPSIGFDPKPHIGIARLAAQAVAASRPIVGEALGTLVESAGGRLAISVYGDSIAITASVPATAARAVVHAMTTAYFAPVVSVEGFQKAQRDMASEAYVTSFDPEVIVRDAVFATLFTSGPQHFSTLGAPRDVAALSETDVRSFAVRAFRAGNATVVLSGAVDATLARSVVLGRPGDTPAEDAVAPALALDVAPVRQTAQPAGGGYGWVGPSIRDEREATAMDFIADYLFRAEDGVVTRRIAEMHPGAFVAGQFITLHDPGVMFVAFSGADQAELRGDVDAGIASVRTPLDGPAFSGALASFKYHILSDLQTPTQLADNYGWYVVEGAPEYAPGARGDGGLYAKAVDSLSPEFVAAVARKFLVPTGAIITLEQAAHAAPASSAPPGDAR